MAALPDLKPIRLESFKDVPSWGEAIVTTLNKFTRDVFFALSSLTFSENFAAKILEVTFTTPADYATGGFTAVIVPDTLGTRASGALLIKIFQVTDPSVKFLTAPAIANWTTDGTSIRINYVTGLTANIKYTMTFLYF